MEIYQLVLIVISIILVTKLFSSKSIEKNAYNIPRHINSHKVINKEIKKPLEKKVTFNLHNNKVYEIKKHDKNFEHIKKKYFYGEDILDNNKKNIKNIKIQNPQQTMVNRLQTKKEEILENTKDIYSYWENLNRGNFSDRQYLNAQVNDFNKFKSYDDIHKNKEISKVFDELTKGQTNPYQNFNDDLSITNDKTFIDGFSTSCNYHNLDNIEN